MCIYNILKTNGSNVDVKNDWRGVSAVGGAILAVDGFPYVRTAVHE